MNHQRRNCTVSRAFEQLEPRLPLTVSLFADLNSDPSGVRFVAGRGGAPEMAQLGNLAVFPMLEGQQSADLWVSDGSAEGTRLLVDCQTRVDLARL